MERTGGEERGRGGDEGRRRGVETRGGDKGRRQEAETRGRKKRMGREG